MSPNPPSLVRAFRQDGFVHVPGLLSPSQVQGALASFERLRRAASRLPGTTELGGSLFVLGDGPRGRSVARVVWCGGAEPPLLAIGRHPAVVGLAATLLRSRDLVHIINQAHFKEPGDGVAFPWHQDSAHRRYGTPEWTDVDGEGSFVEIVVALDPMDETNGGLRFLPGSHRDGHLPHDADRNLRDPVSDDGAVLLPLQPGDAVAFGPYVVHGSAPNEGAYARRTLLNGFALPGANRRVYPGCGVGEPVSFSGLRC